MKYEVVVEKRLYCTGVVTVDCDDPVDALALVQNQIDSGKLTTAMVKWGKPEYEDCSFDAISTEDVYVAGAGIGGK